MRPNFTDKDKYPRGYVRSESTDVTKTWAAVRKRFEQDRKLSGCNVRTLKQIAGAKP